MKRRAIQAVVEELERRKANGETRVSVTDATLAQLRKATGRSAPKAAAPAPAAPAPAVSASPPARAADPVTPFLDPAPKARAAEPVRRARVVREPVPEGMLEVEPGFLIKAPPAAPTVTLASGTREQQWEALRQTVIDDPVCREHVRAGRQVVFGVGPLDAPIFFCGEAPGADEEAQGEPFVGKAGQLLTKMIQGMGLRREDVYIGNILNWRPEKANMEVGNRKPLAAEMAYCLPYLQAQIAVVQPKVIVALGATAMEGLLGVDPTRKISKVRGTWFEYENRPLMPTFHPSYILQYASEAVKRQVWEDLLQVMEGVGLPINDKQRKFFQPK